MILSTLLMLLPTLLYLAGTVLARRSWLPARYAAALALLFSLAAVLLPLLPLPAPVGWLATAPLNLLMSVLVSLLGFLVVRFSVRYLAGDAAEQRFRHWLQLCLAAVSLVVISNHLLLFWLGWSIISISLHQLLVCYPERFRAVLAAHKKFILARIGETALLGAVLLLAYQHDTFLIDKMLAEIGSNGSLTLIEQLAAVLLALAALIKCAQMPLHGWLMQVVEAPTPVSALLHAGVINLGGFLMITMAPLIALSTPARTLLLVVAGLTAVLAALIMTTRISIKVRLAWSTCAQMGLMLVECALGLYQLALLHLLAHSCYKAHAFLTSGEAVNQYLQQRLTPAQPLALLPWSRNLLLTTALVISTLLLLPTSVSGAEWAAAGLVALALSFWLPMQATIADWSKRGASALLLLAAYLLQKHLFTAVVPATAEAGLIAILWVALLGLLLIGGYGLLASHSRLGSRWQQSLFAGLYLDEWLTRTTLRIWPVQLPMASSRKPLDNTPPQPTLQESA